MSWPAQTLSDRYVELLDSALVTQPTREAIHAKLDRRFGAPRAFSPEAFATLRALCDRLIPQTEPHVDIAGALDARLADNKRNGWRYDTLPPDLEAHRRGLVGVDETSRALFEATFVDLTGETQDEVLRALVGGEPPGATWGAMPVDRWFEELLVEVTEIYFAHPVAQQAIGYVGFADAQGWRAIGLDGDEDTERHEAV